MPVADDDDEYVVRPERRHHFVDGFLARLQQVQSENQTAADADLDEPLPVHKLDTSDPVAAPGVPKEVVQWLQQKEPNAAAPGSAKADGSGRRRRRGRRGSSTQMSEESEDVEQFDEKEPGGVDMVKYNEIMQRHLSHVSQIVAKNAPTAPVTATEPAAPMSQQLHAKMKEAVQELSAVQTGLLDKETKHMVRGIAQDLKHMDLDCSDQQVPGLVANLTAAVSALKRINGGAAAAVVRQELMPTLLEEGEGLGEEDTAQQVTSGQMLSPVSPEDFPQMLEIDEGIAASGPALTPVSPQDFPQL